METHYTAEGSVAGETVRGELIDYVWIVCRPPERGENPNLEILGVYKERESAESHAKIADREGETTLRREQCK